jgi:hypothetical protein
VRGLSVATAGESVLTFIDSLASYVKSIDGAEGTVVEFLSIQPQDILMQIYGAILRGSTLSETERKNSPSPSDLSSPAVEVETAKTADPDAASLSTT